MNSDSGTQELQFTGGAAQYLKEIEPVLQEREAMQVALVNILQTLLESEIPDDYEGMNLEYGPYRLRALYPGIDISTREDVLYCTFERVKPFEGGVPQKLLGKIDPDIENEKQRRESMCNLPMYERIFEKDGYCTELIYMIGERGEVLVGTGLSLNEIFERSERKIAGEDIVMLVRLLESKGLDKKTKIFLLGNRKTEAEIMKAIKRKTVTDYSSKLTEKIRKQQEN